MIAPSDPQLTVPPRGSPAARSEAGQNGPVGATALPAPPQSTALPLIYRVLLGFTILLAVVEFRTLAQGPFAGPLGTFSVLFLSIFLEAAPFLLLGTLVSGVIDTFIQPEQITRWVPRRLLPALLVGVGAGFLFPVCECGVVPVVRRLSAKGLPRAVGVTFLLAAPVMNPIVLFSTWTAFGFGPVLIGRYLITAFVALTTGLVFRLVERRAARTGLAPATLVPVLPPLPSAAPRPALGPGLAYALLVAGSEFFEMGRYLVVGASLAAGLQTVVSQETLTALGQGPLVSVLTMQGLAFVLSVCSTVDAFLALAFVGTFSTGSILTFLTFGPMVDIKSTILFLGTFPRKTVAALVLLPLVLTGAIGILLNLSGLF